jgi:diguanylate cyclase (GGDEF)-like protein
MKITNWVASAKNTNTAFRKHIEAVFAAIVLLLTLVYLTQPEYRDAVRYAYFLPVVCCAFLLGSLRASILALLAFILVICFALAGTEVVSTREWLSILSWGCSLGFTGAILGLMSTNREQELVEQINDHSASANIDPLTKIENRRAFSSKLDRMFANFQNLDTTFSLLLVDIDKFKQINDRFGHSAGDLVLTDVASEIRSCLRDQEDIVARIGGEEFAVLLPDTEQCEAFAIAERIREHIQNRETIAGEKRINVTVSIGGAQIAAGDSIQSLYETADERLYCVKQNGRNSVCFDLESLINAYDQVGVETEANELRQRFHQELDKNSITSRMLFEWELHRRVAESARYRLPLSVCVFEIRGIHGSKIEQSHVEAVFAKLVEQFEKTFRAIDLVARYSDQFVATVLPHTTESNAAFPIRRLIAQMQMQSPDYRANALDHVIEARIGQHFLGETSFQFVQRVLDSRPIGKTEKPGPNIAVPDLAVTNPPLIGPN